MAGELMAVLPEFNEPAWNEPTSPFFSFSYETLPLGEGLLLKHHDNHLGKCRPMYAERTILNFRKRSEHSNLVHGLGRTVRGSVSILGLI